MYTLVHVYYQAYKKRKIPMEICAVTYMQPKKLAGFFMNLGEKLICRSAMHACMHLDVQAKELAS